MDEIEQYTEESGRRLSESAAALVGLIEQYAVAVQAMHGGSSERSALFERNRELASAVAEWNERAFDHTGTSPLLLEEIEAGDLDDEDDEDDEESLPLEGQISVVSRWDLDVVNSAELIAAGHAAHRRHRPEETDEDADVAVHDATSAVTAITGEAWELWFEIPGVLVLSGVRVFVVPDERLEPLSVEPETGVDAVEAPAGQLTLVEAWQ